jgi:hypothetical protein
VAEDEIEFDLIPDEPLDFPGQATYQTLVQEKPCYICRARRTNQAMVLKRGYMPICSGCVYNLAREPRIS